jgi:hypothetical protein
VRSATNRFHRVVIFVLVVFCAASATTAMAQQKGAGVPAVRPVTAIPMPPEGVAQLTLPVGWESNPRMAEDNAAPGFLHPSGTPVGKDLPFWVVVDRCPRNMVETFPSLVKRTLEEGKPYGFTLQDSTSFRTSDGRRVSQCIFEPTKEGAKRGLAFVEIPIGAILFRFQAADDKTWDQYRASMDEILRGVRFLETKKGTSGK